MWFYLLVLLLILVILPLAVAGKSFAPWVPIWNKDLERVMTLAKLQPGEVFYDLGCGNGKAVFYAAKQYQANAVGVELAWPLWLWCLLRKTISHTPSVRFKLANLFKVNVSNANVVYVFGMPQPLQQKLADKLLAELKPGSRVVSYSFPIPGLPNEYKDKPAPDRISIYRYTL